MNITIEIEDKAVISCLLNAHSRYWARELDWNGKKGSVIETQDGPERTILFNRKDIVRGVRLMAQKCPRVFAALSGDNYDGETGDVLLQLVVFRELKYS